MSSFCVLVVVGALFEGNFFALATLGTFAGAFLVVCRGLLALPVLAVDLADEARL